MLAMHGYATSRVLAQVFNIFFSLLFLVELILRLSASGRLGLQLPTPNPRDLPYTMTQGVRVDGHGHSEQVVFLR